MFEKQRTTNDIALHTNLAFHPILCKNSTLYRWSQCYPESGEFLQNQVCFQGHSSGILIEPHVLTHYATLLNGYSVHFLKLSGLLFFETAMNCLPSSHTGRFQIRRNCSNSGIGGFIIFKCIWKILFSSFRKWYRLLGSELPLPRCQTLKIQNFRIFCWLCSFLIFLISHER